jgi:hypothetical protein
MIVIHVTRGRAGDPSMVLERGMAMNHAFRGMVLRGLTMFAMAAMACGTALADQGPSKPPAPWVKHENLAPVVGADGKTHQAACSGFPGTDPRFSFWSKEGKEKKLVVFFEGGGACWDSFSCSRPITGLTQPEEQLFVPMVPPGTDPAAFNGIFKLDNPDNPVGDWSMVYIPYCTGDLHIGSAEKQYTSVGHGTLNIPPGFPFTIQHRGFDNFMVVLEWIKANFDDASQILVSGSSAGGYGASANFPWVKEAFPQARTHVIADASQGVSVPGFDSGNPGRLSWNPQLAPWVYGGAVDFPGPDLLRISANHYPNVKTAQFTTNVDGVQILFYGVMEALHGPAGNCPNPVVDWNNQMLSSLSFMASDVDNFRHYVAGGSYHTIMRSPQFYTEASAGLPYAKWVAGMLKSQGGTRGKGGNPWANVACPSCLTPIPCVGP